MFLGFLMYVKMKDLPARGTIRVRPGPNTVIFRTIHCPKVCWSDAGKEFKQKDEVIEDETVVVFLKEEKAENEAHVELSEKQKNQPNSVGEKIPTKEFLNLQLTSATVGEPANPKEKPIHRRFLTWIDGVVHDHYCKKIRRTYVREQEERGQLYPPNFYIFYQETRGQRERQKREIWLSRDKQRQNIKNWLDAHWEKKREATEALRQKEEERYERWVAQNNTSIPDSSQGGPKKRMGLWQKKSL
ncbi:uncharacterized protein [Nothobranchius furzeri]|uniref:LOC107385949-like protein n=1 Tax=Nothobranchius furzeri TaxID=105023 RepID=A0A9D2XTQ7_NOTFU|nr:putative LOC107385949-like protein [Nothobranchius furzeri]